MAIITWADIVDMSLNPTAMQDCPILRYTLDSHVILGG